jgi:hypothetical protein
MMMAAAEIVYIWASSTHTGETRRSASGAYIGGLDHFMVRCCRSDRVRDSPARPPVRRRLTTGEMTRSKH